VLKLFFLTLLFVSSLLANKVIYLSYEDIPQRVIEGEIFRVTLKSLSTVRDFDDIVYSFEDAQGVELLNEIPYREVRAKYYYDTFYFFTNKSQAATPNITASLVFDDNRTEDTNAANDLNSSFFYPATTLKGKKLNVITLNPKSDFSGIIADEFVLQEFKTTSYDTTHNIVVFVATAKNTKIDMLHFSNVYKQGIESLEDSYFDSKITYYVVIDKKLENFSFSYFNLEKNKYLKLSIPIIVDDDSVVAQSDLKPKDQSKEQLKINIAAAVAFVAFLFILWRKKYIYLVFILIPLVYIAYMLVPQKDVCIKAEANIYLLPVSNGTIFETTQTQQFLPKEGFVENFVKVKLKNEKIGWVKNEDTCSY